MFQTMGTIWKTWTFLVVLAVLFYSLVLKQPNSVELETSPKFNSNNPLKQDLHKPDSSHGQGNKGHVSHEHLSGGTRGATEESSSAGKEFHSALELKSVAEEYGDLSQERQLQKQQTEDVYFANESELGDESASQGSTTRYHLHPNNLPRDGFRGNRTRPAGRKHATPAVHVHFNSSSITEKNLRNLYLDHQNFLQVEPPTYLPDVKNPCWNETYHSGESRLRCIPYFYLAGFPKSGTTDLFFEIIKHPQIVPPARKEPHWWTRGRFSGRDFHWYVEFFEKASSNITSHRQQQKESSAQIITGEASASTLWDIRGLQYPENINKTEPELILAHELHHFSPRAKVIVIVRNPTFRLYSDYLYFSRTAGTPQSFHEMVQADLETMETCLSNEPERLCAYRKQSVFKTRLYIGMYAVFIEDWLKVLPRDQLHVVRLEDYAQDKQTAFDEIFEFLQLNPVPSRRELFDEGFKRNSRRKSDAKKGPMLQETKDLLDDFYRPYNTRLAHLLEDEGYLWMDGAH